jgi:muramoyltetrapeptide carboxypeptidase
MQSNAVRKGRPLRRGDVIGLLAPASPASPTDVESVVRYLERLGYRVELSPQLSSTYLGYLAGSDEQRLQELHRFFADPRIAAIFCLRGGYGSIRLLANLDYRLIARHPKLLVGSSDITALQAALWQRAHLVTISAPIPGNQPIAPDREAWFWQLLTSPTAPGELPDLLQPLSPLPSSTVRGRILCGTLSLWSALCGTPFLPKTDGALFITEDVGEPPYRVDRMLTQLLLSGAFAQVSAIIFGAFTQPGETRLPNPSWESVLRDFAERAQLPCLHGLSYGHIPQHWALPFGVQARIRRGGFLALDEAATEQPS